VTVDRASLTPLFPIKHSNNRYFQRLKEMLTRFTERDRALDMKGESDAIVTEENPPMAFRQQKSSPPV
jgi:hypothetical protein